MLLALGHSSQLRNSFHQIKKNECLKVSITDGFLLPKMRPIMGYNLRFAQLLRAEATSYKLDKKTRNDD